MKSLSSFNGYGEMAGTSYDPYGMVESDGSPVDYNGSPSNSAWYSYQEGLSGFQGHQQFHGPYGANIFQRIFTPRKWEAESGKDEGTARLFSAGKSKVDRLELRAGRKAKKDSRKSKRRAAQYRIVRIADGTRVKQDGNNVYTFVGRPPRKSKYRHHKSGDTQTPSDHHWQELHADVLEANGPFSPGASAADWAPVAAVSGNLALDILKVFKGAPPEDSLPDLPSGGPMQASGGIPKQYLLIGGGVLGVVLLVALLKK
jgi:hypothetical protein